MATDATLDDVFSDQIVPDQDDPFHVEPGSYDNGFCVVPKYPSGRGVDTVPEMQEIPEHDVTPTFAAPQMLKSPFTHNVSIAQLMVFIYKCVR